MNLVFAHANGFPAGTYRTLFEAWRAAGFTVHALPKVGHDPRFPVTSNWPPKRRQHWPSTQAAYEHFAAKPAFARWAPDVLREYISCGVEPGEHGQRLSFDRTVETAIYNTLPHQLDRVLRRHPLQCPMAFVRGSASDEVRRVGMSATQRLAQGRVSVIEGGHLFPFEKPVETAAEVTRWITALTGIRP